MKDTTTTKYMANFVALIALLSVLGLARTEVGGSTREEMTRSEGGSAAGGDVVLYVDDDGDPGGDCLSWDTACPDLQDALDYAFTHPEVIEIRVAGGTYYPDRGTGIRPWTFQLLDNLALNGGYRGCPGGDCAGGDPDERDIALYESILSGEIGDPKLTTDNSYHVVSGTATDSTATIDGFTITAGRADGSAPHDAGAGFINTGGSPLISNCTFSDNYATDSGAGMFQNREGADLVLTDCTFTGNSSGLEAGGAIIKDAANVTVSGCTFSENSTGTYSAGGLGIWDSGDVVVTDSTFTGNSAPNKGGGLRLGNSGYLYLANCTFDGNTVFATSSDQGHGGGVYCADVTADNCIFTGNSATSEGNYVGNSGRGGGLYATSSAILTECDFTDNTATGVWNYGDSKGLGGGVFSGAVTATDCTFSNNLAGASGNGAAWSGRGGGIYSWSTCAVVRCTFTANWAEYWSGHDYEYNAHGAGICANILEATDCQFVGNRVWHAGNWYGRGGGVWAVSATLDDCEFTKNVATGGGTTNGYGGAVYINDGSTIASNCTFDGNTANYQGGAMYLYDATDTITNCTFTGNMAVTSGGGAIQRYSPGLDPGTVTNCLFQNNTCGGNGGAIRQGGASLDLDHCTFEGNTAALNGGALYHDAISESITDCVFTGNTSDLDGGAIFLADGCSPMISGCDFDANVALDKGGAIACVDGSSPTMVNNVLTGNQADLGGAMYFFNNSNATVVNSSLDSNAAATYAGALYIDNCQVVVANCILWNSSPNEVYDIQNQVQIDYCDIQGGWPKDQGEGNINADPMFVDPGNGFYSLLPGSPCIDSGDNNRVPTGELYLDCDGNLIEPIPIDHDGNARFHDDPKTVDTGVPSEDYPDDIVDMGAYEFGAPPLCPWDLDCNGSVDTGDLLALFAQWGSDGSADFDESGVVNTTDLLILFANWGPCPK